MTVNELGSAIRNHIFDGLKGEISNLSYSREQLIDEAFLYRNKIIMEFSMKGKYDITPFMQTIDAIPIEEFDLSTNKIIKSGICRNYVKIPNIAPTFDDISIEYIGPVSKEKSFKIYYDTKFNHHKYRMRTASNPYVYVDMDSDADGMIDVMLFNLNQVKDLRYLTVRGVFANPLDLNNLDCCTDVEDDEFPAPAYVQDMIIDRIVQRYVSQYRQMNIPEFPNKQTDVNR